MPLIDWIFLALMLLCVINGLWQGAYPELLGLVHFALSLLIATVIHVIVIPEVLHHLSQTYFDSNLVYAVSLVVIFIISWLVLKILFSLILIMTSSSNANSPATRVFGGVLGAGKGAVLVLLAIMAADYSSLADQSFWQQSWTAQQFEPIAQQIRHGLAYADSFARENIEQLVRPYIESQPAQIIDQ